MFTLPWGGRSVNVPCRPMKQRNHSRSSRGTLPTNLVRRRGLTRSLMVPPLATAKLAIREISRLRVRGSRHCLPVNCFRDRFMNNNTFLRHVFNYLLECFFLLTIGSNP